MIVWQKAKALSVNIYKSFENSKDYGFRDQILRSSISIMNNIAEGFERHSNSEFRHFLYISKGSCGELRSMLHLAKDINKIDDEQYEKLIKDSVEISRMLSGFIKKL